MAITIKAKKRKLHVYVLEQMPCFLRMSNGEMHTSQQWALKTKDGAIIDVLVSFNKKAAIGYASETLIRLHDLTRQHSELRIRNKNGTFAPARTYPRSADPRKSRG